MSDIDPADQRGLAWYVTTNVAIVYDDDPPVERAAERTDALMRYWFIQPRLTDPAQSSPAMIDDDLHESDPAMWWAIMGQPPNDTDAVDRMWLPGDGNSYPTA